MSKISVSMLCCLKLFVECLVDLDVSICTMQANVDKDKVKAALKAQQDQQLDNASILDY